MKQPTYLLGRFCFACRRDFLVSFGKMVLLAIKTTWREENFFSSSRTTRVWIFCHAFNCGGGTRIRMAFLCFSVGPTSISRAPQMWSSRRWVLRSEFNSKSRIAWKRNTVQTATFLFIRYIPGTLVSQILQPFDLQVSPTWPWTRTWWKNNQRWIRDGRSQKRENRVSCRCLSQIRFRLLCACR